MRDMYYKSLSVPDLLFYRMHEGWYILSIRYKYIKDARQEMSPILQIKKKSW